MPRLLVILLIAVSAVPAEAQQVSRSTERASAVLVSPSATVWGQVRSEKDGTPLRQALVEVLTPSRQQIFAVTDSLGVYVMHGVPPGRRLVRATHIDHAPNEAEMLFAGGEKHILDFELEFRPLRLMPLTAQGMRELGGTGAADTTAVSASELSTTSIRVLESTPGVAELGLAEAAREVPGYEPVDPTDVLYVRGASADLKLVLLNGAPVYAPFHIGGLIHALDADVLRSAVLHMGGAPARYDGGLSYVMDLETRAGRNKRPHAKLSVDMLAARTLLEGPLGKNGSMLVAGRMVHGQGTRSWSGEAFPYAYGDALSRLDLKLGPQHLVTVTGFWNQERVSLDTVGGERQQANWGNRSASARYRGKALGHDVLGTVSAGRFRTTLPLGGIQPLLTEGTANRTRVAFDFERSVGSARLNWGGSFDRIDFEYRAYPQDKDRDDVIAGPTRGVGDVSGMYAEATVSPISRVRVRGGVRADVFSRDPQVRLAPRLSATVLLTDRVALTLSGGQYRQYVRTPERSLVFLGNVAPDSGGGLPLSVAEASHLVLGLAQDLGGGIRLGLDGHFKQFDGLHFARAKKTEASGVDLWVRRGTGSYTGWLGYSLAWIWTVEEEQPRRTQSFSGRHLVSAGAAGPILGAGNFDIRVSYGAGLPYTAIPEPETEALRFSVLDSSPTGDSEGGSVTAEPQEPYIRVDAQLQRTFNTSIRGFDFDFTPYLKVINALNRRDAIFYHYNRDVGYAEPVAGLPIVPIVGLEWKF